MADVWSLLQRHAPHQARRPRRRLADARRRRRRAPQRFVQYYTAFLAALAEGLAGAGEAVRGLAVVDEALARSDKSEERWILAELLRLKGELVLLHNAPATAVAEDHFQQSLEWARRQGALAWELRTATSLARLWRRQGKTTQARKLLATVYRRFTEGFDTADLVAAKALIQSLR